MTFSHPLRLSLLLGVAALAVVYLLVHLSRSRAIERYTNPSLHGLIAPDRLGWRRHVPPALALAALALLCVGIAQPTRAERVAKDQGVVVLAVDVSASMTATDVAPTRIGAAIAGARKFVDGVPAGIDVGLVAFDRNARLLVAPTTDHGVVLRNIAALAPGPGTAAGEGVYTALDAIRAVIDPAVLAAAKSDAKLPAAIVLLSDGKTTVGRPVEQAAQAAADVGVPVSTIAFGTPTGTVTVQGQVVDVPADTAAMADVAAATGGRYFEATTAGELRHVYADIRTQVGSTIEQREVTRGLLGIALALLVAAIALGARWASRAL